MRILSWNVNGLRSVMGKGFPSWLASSGGDIVGVQEVRAREDQLAPSLEAIQGDWHRAFFAAERPGYSGVGLLSRLRPDRVKITLGDPVFDREGRCQIARFG